MSLGSGVEPWNMPPDPSADGVRRDKEGWPLCICGERLPLLEPGADGHWCAELDAVLNDGSPGESEWR